ncbi:MAG TPA: hypothetical protein DCR55_15045 [Lentisphaeria bacterium]|nr:hypothetical protein [Lentisphaeria bacterium]
MPRLIDYAADLVRMLAARLYSAIFHPPRPHKVATMRVLVLLILASFLIGCQTTAPADADPEAAFDVPIPPAWTSSHSVAGVPGLTAWAEDLQDPLLVDLIHDGLAHNFSLQASRAALHAISATVLRGLAAREPSLALNGDGRRSRSVNDERGRQPDAISASLALGVAVSWELDLWGRLRHEAYATARDLEAAGWTDRGARLAIAVAIARQYCDAITAKYNLTLARENIGSFGGTLQTAEQRYRSGLLNGAAEVHLSRANVANSERALHSAEREYDAAVRALEALVGRYPQAALSVADQLPYITAVPAGIPADLLARRPDVCAAEARLAAAGLRTRVARAQAFPAVRLTANTGTSSDTLRKILHPSHMLWSLAAGVTQPLFDGGAISAGIMAADARQQQALANYAQTALTAYQEVETALAADAFLTSELAALQVAAHESQAAEAETRENYDNGLVELTALLVAQRRSVDARRSRITVTNRRLQNRLGLYLALGGGFER